MKNLTTKIIMIGFPTIFGFHFLFGVLFAMLYHKSEIDYFDIIFRALVFGLFYTSVFTFGYRSFFNAKFKFLETDIPIEKRFGNSQSIVNIDTELDFDKFKQSLNTDFVTTFVDKKNYTIKVRDKFRLFSWGAAAVVRIDNKCVMINSFPMNGSSNKLNKELTDKIIDKIKKSTTAQHTI